ncbi:CDP-alcohol phosphatidyltransferase family protein [Bacteroidetes bacterium endosymbiont of Geopemphigus sp.]|uniref:CDP-alcohol phosphatidyltransferase family protein n=1 Tax=Bacteroidetes bacterium endosymbiont of Geopemphigus sp. TaxID=2047937 RepID=UPI000CD2CF99|nr:CDP-alcohol phosphatidyltransferase family protein [Bacteroidetes bacterium endosymbiont of Geopemphigus sp.]
MRKHLSNLLTLANLFCGCIAVVLLLRRPDYEKVALLSFVSLILDFFDGFLARLLNEKSQLGGELDSLADLVSFGLVPALIVFNFLEESTFIYPSFSLCKWSAFAIVLCSAWRLANFNLDKTQRHDFKGLATPANALFFTGISIVTPEHIGYNCWKFILSSPVLLFLMLFFSCILLVSKFPMFSLKFSSTLWSENFPRYIFLTLASLLFISLRLAAIPWVIVLYILLSLLYKKHLFTHL